MSLFVNDKLNFKGFRCKASVVNSADNDDTVKATTKESISSVATTGIVAHVTKICSDASNPEGKNTHNEKYALPQNLLSKGQSKRNKNKYSKIYIFLTVSLFSVHLFSNKF